MDANLFDGTYHFQKFNSIIRRYEKEGFQRFRSRLNEFMQLAASKNTMGYKDPITFASKIKAGDLHAWVETSKGDILDYSNNHPYYQVVRNLNGATKGRVYHALSPKETRAA